MKKIILYKYSKKSFDSFALEGTPLNISDYLELRHAIGRLTLQQTAIDDWLDELSNIYIEVAMKYGFLNLNDLLGYLFERQNRNADSHFSDYLQYFNSHDPHPCAAFINTDDYLRGEFDENETNLLEYTFERCCDDLRRNPRLTILIDSHHNMNYLFEIIF